MTYNSTHVFEMNHRSLQTPFKVREPFVQTLCIEKYSYMDTI